MPHLVSDVSNAARRPIAALALLLILTLAACQQQGPTGPTPIPTERPTASPTITATSAFSPTPPPPPPTLRGMITATVDTSAAPVVNVPLPTVTPQPPCFQARAGDTIDALLLRSGMYIELSAPLRAAFRALNRLDPNSNIIQAGQNYCVPRPTPTPTPPGYEATVAMRMTELPMAVGPVATATYIPKEGENIITVQLNSGASLRELCSLNPPEVLNCGGCDITKPIGQQGCRPLIRAGQPLSIPGPTPTPSITPTLSGSETPTPTPGYTEPVVVAPAFGATVEGVPQLIWLPTGVLEPNEFYLVVWSDLTAQQTYQERTQANSVRLPISLMPRDGQPHTINWQVGVAVEGADGSYIWISPRSRIFTFTWRGE